MSDLKGCIDCSTTWETKDNRSLCDILSCSLVEAGESCLQTTLLEDLPTSGCGAPKTSSLRLRPFLHPEMTESAGHCELRLFVPPRLHKRIAKIAVRSSARNIEVYDRLGEYLLTARGERSEAVHSSRYYTAVFHVHPECFEVTLKFVSLSEEANLRLHLVHVTLVPYVWTGDLPSLGASQSLPSGALNFERVHELLSTSPESLSPSAKHLLALLEQQQQTASNSGPVGHARGGSSSLPVTLLSHFLANQHLSSSSAGGPVLSGRALSQDGKRDSSDSTSSGDQAASGAESGLLVTRWLDARLLAMETRIMGRLDEICARVAALEGNKASAATAATAAAPTTTITTTAMSTSAEEAAETPSAVTEHQAPNAIDSEEDGKR